MPQPQRDRPARIVVVDDDPTLLNVLQAALADEGYDVSCALRPAEGHALIREQRPDLVILDLLYSGRQDGVCLIERLKQDPALRDIPVIVCSAARKDPDELLALSREYGVCILRKPFDLEALLDAVVRALVGTMEKALQESRRGAPARYHRAGSVSSLSPLG